MKFGRLRHIVLVQSPTDTTADDGTNVVNYTTVGICRADVRVSMGQEVLRNGEITGQSAVIVTMRYEQAINSQLDRKHRLVIDGDSVGDGLGDRTLDVTAPAHVDLRRKLVTAVCVERDR